MHVLRLSQMISAELQWFLGGVFVTYPAPGNSQLNITVRLLDANSALLSSNNNTRVQVSYCCMADMIAT